MTGQPRSLTAACRASLTVLSCLYSGAAVCLVPASTSTVAKDAPAPKIHVFIVGVPSWQMKDYKPVSPATDTVLGRSIVSACDDIRRFFTERFGDQVVIHPSVDKMCTPASTTQRAIRLMFKTELPAAAKGTVAFVFMMSHGEPISRPGSFIANDLRFITSDTTDENSPVGGVEVNGDLWPWLANGGITAGSTVLLFIDTCSAGRADTPQLRVETAQMEAAGLRFGLLLSSMKEEPTYAAAFTRAVLKLWQQPVCPLNEGVRVSTWLHDRIEETVGPLDGFEGYPDVVIGFRGGFCLGPLGADAPLLLFYNGAAGAIRWCLQETTTAVRECFEDSNDEPYEFHLVKRGRYSIEGIALSTGEVRRWVTGALDGSATQGIFWEYPSTTEGAVEMMRDWAGKADYRGLPAAEVAELRKAAESIRRALVSAVQRVGDPTTIATTTAQEDPASLEKRARKLLADGSAAKAALLFSLAAEKLPDSDGMRSDGMRREASLAAVAAGDCEAAVRFGSLVSGFPSSEVCRVTPGSIAKWRSAATVELVLSGGGSTTRKLLALGDTPSTSERWAGNKSRVQIEEQKKLAEEQAAAVKRQADEQVATARRVADEERAPADEARSHAAEREKTQGDLLVRLQQIERSVRVEPRGIVLTLPGSVYFESSRSDVNPGARERLARIGQALAGASDRKILVEGHTDSTGSVEFNTKLSELRAESVKAILVENAVSPDRIETHGYASTKPVASNGAPASRSQNRRVEVVVQGAVR
jgi:OmpA-OmpF porin, OOP family